MNAEHTLEEVLGFTRELVPAAQQYFPGCEAWLFGSYAKGCAGPASDIDVGILVPAGDIDRYVDEGSMWDRACALWDAAAALDDMIATCIRDADSSFAGVIRETGIRVA